MELLKDRWVKVSEQIPQKEDQYLVVRRGYIEILTFDKFYCNWYTADGDDYAYELKAVTHWMPLPSLPINEELK